jgi:hypothetical protein
MTKPTQTVKKQERGERKTNKGVGSHQRAIYACMGIPQ